MHPLNFGRRYILTTSTTRTVTPHGEYTEYSETYTETGVISPALPTAALPTEFEMSTTEDTNMAGFHDDSESDMEAIPNPPASTVIRPRSLSISDSDSDNATATKKDAIDDDYASEGERQPRHVSISSDEEMVTLVMPEEVSDNPSIAHTLPPPLKAEEEPEASIQKDFGRPPGTIQHPPTIDTPAETPDLQEIAERMTREVEPLRQATVEYLSDSEEEEEGYDEFLWRARGRRFDIQDEDETEELFEDPINPGTNAQGIDTDNDFDSEDGIDKLEDEEDEGDNEYEDPQQPPIEPEQPGPDAYRQPPMDPQIAQIDESAQEEMDYKFYVDIHGFDYMRVRNSPMTEKEFASISVHSIRHYKGMSRRGEDDITQLMKIQDRGKAPHNHRTTEGRILARTGLKVDRYDVCKKSCFCYAADPRAHCCPWCGTPRYNEKGKPWKTFDYVQLIPRLMLQYSNPERAKTFMTYRHGAEARALDAEEPTLVDFWGSKLHQELKSEGLFDKSTDIGYNDENVLHLGVCPGPQNPRDFDSFLYPFKKEMKLLEKGIDNVYNAATNRPFTLRAHICVIGADIPARKKLTHTAGVGSYDFCLHCKQEAVGTNTFCYCPFKPPIKNLPEKDTAARSVKRKKLSSRKPVEKGHSLPVYDPKTMNLRTHDEYMEAFDTILETKDVEKAKKIAGVVGYSVFAQFKSVKFPRSFPYDGMHLWFENIIPRMFNHWRGRFTTRKGGQVIVVQQPAQDEGNEGAKESDTSENSSDSESDGDVQPRKRRRIAKNGSDEDSSSASLDSVQYDSEGNLLEDASSSRTTRGSKRNRKAKGKAKAKPKPSTRKPAANASTRGTRGRGRASKVSGGRSSAKKAGTSKANATQDGKPEHGLKPVSKRNIAKFEDSGEPWCIHPKQWERIGQEMAKSGAKGLIPSVFGTNIRSIHDTVTQWKAEEWRNWGLRYADIYLESVMPEKFYKQFGKLTNAIQMCCEYEITPSDVSDIRQLIYEFIVHYERDYYQYDYERISYCLPVFHYIAHVADALEDCGPQFVYTQWCVERACGTLARGVKSRSAVNRNISLNIVRMECYNHLKWTFSEWSFRRILDLGREALEEDVSRMISHARIRYAYLHRILTRGGSVDAADGSNRKVNENVREGDDADMFEFKAAKAPITVDQNLRRMLRESNDADVWKALTPHLWDKLQVRKFTACKYFTPTSQTIMYSSTLKPDKVKRQAWVVGFTAGIEKERKNHVGEIDFYFDVEPRIGTEDDADYVVLKQLCDAFGRSLVTVRGYDLARKARFLRFVERKGALIVIPAKDVNFLVGLVESDGKQFITLKECSTFDDNKM
ncbi:hypothetical protein BJ508DRAFT_327224 [Ascobolus immersus RN42]|uniref:Transposase domain-containing protein n=1 Tax=Ascobolus immersus RN42 TaxID=1160509 RepID=A0A3N4I325_ASCIM|nr:hypothetical protein BJ508DRAFT_327224 [Ascobolus immersus RN42]